MHTDKKIQVDNKLMLQHPHPVEVGLLVQMELQTQVVVAVVRILLLETADQE
jgi:hypothetical protein